MKRYPRKHIAILLAIAVCILAPFDANAARIPEIKKFSHFPVDTFDLAGTLSDLVLEETTTPYPSLIDVLGWWPDRQLVLISFADEAYYVHFRALEMTDQGKWNRRMHEKGGLRCNKLWRTHGDIKATKAAWNGFALAFTNPC